MKQYSFATAIVLLLSSFFVPLKKINIHSSPLTSAYTFAAQGTTGMPDMNLEELSAAYQTTKGKTATASLTINGAKSAIRLQVGAGQFIATPVPGMPSVPSENISLYKLITDKKNRSLTLDATGVISAAKMNINITQTYPLAYRITITGGLMSGEYAFVEKNMAKANSSLTVWCFGID